MTNVEQNRHSELRQIESEIKVKLPSHLQWPERQIGYECLGFRVEAAPYFRARDSQFTGYCVRVILPCSHEVATAAQGFMQSGTPPGEESYFHRHKHMIFPPFSAVEFEGSIIVVAGSSRRDVYPRVIEVWNSHQASSLEELRGKINPVVATSNKVTNYLMKEGFVIDPRSEQ